jgi:PAS domain S-box-containing protein
VNKGLCEAFGLSREDLLGKTDYDVVPAELADKYRRDDQWVHETGNPLRTPEDVVLPTGEKLLLEVIKIPIHDALGNVIGTQGVFWDQAAWDRRQKELRSATQPPPNQKV